MRGSLRGGVGLLALACAIVGVVFGARLANGDTQTWWIPACSVGVALLLTFIGFYWSFVTTTIGIFRRALTSFSRSTLP